MRRALLTGLGIISLGAVAFAGADGASMGSCVSCGDMKPMAQEVAPATQPAAEKKYTCSMHPEVVSDKPGKCPKCGMKLIEKKQAPSTGEMPGHMHQHADVGH